MQVVVAEDCASRSFLSLFAAAPAAKTARAMTADKMLTPRTTILPYKPPEGTA